ncbi:hypothetical protein O181_021727 [Austropuccinia psidii MF-1]|uniref:Uncharacterized protein n=1 Tax=Austropuccinia psidii MF-1 TaxID=1389203 RepID=A0A9Q3CG28_9BASI|nr:hypothetical protein [Austropuccinia psidii MF-1]
MLEYQQEVQTLEERVARVARIRNNQVTIQSIEEKMNQKEHTMITSGSQGVNQPESPMASHHSSTRKSVANSHHSLQSQVVSRRRQGSKGKSKKIFNKRQKESDKMIQKLLE